MMTEDRYGEFGALDSEKLPVLDEAASDSVCPSGDGGTGGYPASVLSFSSRRISLVA